MSEFLKKRDTIPPSNIKFPREFFEETTPPRFREEAIKLIPKMWDKKTPDERELLFGSLMSDVDRGFFELSWDEIEKKWGKEEAFRTFLLALFGDDTNPLYTADDTIQKL